MRMGRGEAKWRQVISLLSLRFYICLFSNFVTDSFLGST